MTGTLTYSNSVSLHFWLAVVGFALQLASQLIYQLVSLSVCQVSSLSIRMIYTVSRDC